MVEKDIIDADKKKQWFLEEVLKENEKKVKRTDVEDIVASRKKSKSKPKKRKCNCK